jgi:hypothetical protein
MKDIKESLNERILKEIKLKRMESYNKMFQKPVEEIEQPIIVVFQQPMRSFNIILNGENIVTVYFCEVQKTLDRIYKDFETLQIEGFKFQFVDNKCNLIVNTKSNFSIT